MFVSVRFDSRTTRLVACVAAVAMQVRQFWDGSVRCDDVATDDRAQRLDLLQRLGTGDDNWAGGPVRAALAY